MQRYKDRHFLKDDGSFDQLPLPQIMANILSNQRIAYTLYPWDFFTAKSYDTGIESPTNSTYAIHHFAGSWKTEEEKVRIKQSRKLTKFFGVRIANNIVELFHEIKDNGLNGFVKTVKRKLKNKGIF